MLLRKTKRLQKLANAQIPPSQQCLICMNIPSEKADKGILNCSHQSFCFECIIDWANITNQCPLCKERFYEIKNSNTNKIIRVTDKDQKINDDGEYVIDIRCFICGSDLDDDIMLLCDNCDQGFHTICLGMNGIPDTTEWFCDQCVWILNDFQRKKQADAMKKVGRHIDDEEILETDKKPRRRLRRLNDIHYIRRYK